MVLFSFFGRVLFAAFFIFSAWQTFEELRTDGEATVNEFAPKLSKLNKLLSSKLGLAIPNVDPVQFASYVVALKTFGGILFVLNSNTGALLLILQLAFTTPLIFDFYNFKPGSPEFGVLLNGFLQQVAHVGALFFFIGMENSITKRGQDTKKEIHKTKTG